jgi:DNA-binding transcriptional ArsR family regulator
VPDQGIDVVIEPMKTGVQVKRRALVTDNVAERFLAETPRSPDSVLLVVGDRVTETARKLLLVQGAGYYDLCGHLALRSDSVVIDADVEPLAGPVERKQALSGNAGLEIATALLMAPTAGVAVRELARRLGRSASTVSEVLAALRRDGLVDEQHRVEGTRLFWQVADRWPAARVYVAQLLMPGNDATITRPLRLGLENVDSTTGWALTDSTAAVAYGAPLAMRTGQVLDFYVPDQATARRATALLGTAPSRSQARCAVRVPPVPAMCDQSTLRPTRSNGRLPIRSSSRSTWLRTPGGDGRFLLPGHRRRGGRVSGSRVRVLVGPMAGRQPTISSSSTLALCL